MPKQLPRRDYYLLPLLCMVTVLVMFGIAEGASRLLFAEQKENACEVPDARLGHHYRPNCTSVTKAAEGPWVTNRYNECGYRTAQSCGPKPPDTARVAVIGSSVSEGYLIPYEQSFAARATEELSQRCHHPVEFQNLASIGYIWDRLYERLDEVLALSPDAVVLVVVPFDLEQSEAPDAAQPPPGLMKRANLLLDNSRGVLAAQHIMFENLDEYVSLYLRYGDKADFLRPPFSQAWQKRLTDYDALLGRIADRLHERHIPLVLMFVPQRAQAALLAAHTAPSNIDPYALGKAIRSIAVKHGINYADLSPTFAGIPDAAQLYYPVDGHLSGDGHAILARATSRELMNIDVPTLRDCDSTRMANLSIR